MHAGECRHRESRAGGDDGRAVGGIEQVGVASRSRRRGRGARIYQAACPPPVFDGMHAVIGSWVIAGQAAGIGVREDTTAVTTNLSRFVPHYFA